MGAMTVRPTSFVRSLVTDKLVVRMKAATVGEVLTYGELSAACGQDVLTSNGRGALASARKAAQRESGVVFDAIRGQGLKRLKQEEVPSTASRDLKAIRGYGRRGCARLIQGTPDYEAMPAPAKMMRDLMLVQLGAVATAASRQETKRIQEMVSPKQVAADLTALAKSYGAK